MMFAERLKELRKKHNITQEKLSEMIGLERSSVGKYEGKSRVIPSEDVRIKIAELFNVSVDYLMGYTDLPNPVTSSDLTREEYDLLNMYRELNENGQSLTMDYIRMLLAKPDYRKEKPIKAAN